MSINLGFVNLLGAEAIGRPGERRFRLFMRSAQASAFMWMEKEQLNSLSIALDHELALITEGEVLRTEARAGQLPPPTYLPADFPSHPSYDFQVGQMSLSFDTQKTSFLLSILPLVIQHTQELEAIVDADEAVSFAFTQDEARQLSRSIISVVSAGRPVCPLCHEPLDGGPHACIKQNGHREIVQIEDNEDEEE